MSRYSPTCVVCGSREVCSQCRKTEAAITEVAYELERGTISRTLAASDLRRIVKGEVR